MAVQISGNDITVPRDGSFTRNVTIGGTLTYEDVTNIDSVGLVTARNGIEIGARPGVAASISVDGNMIVSGISTFGGSANFAAISGTTGTFTGDVSIADKIIHTGDTNTAIRFPAADTFTVETGGSERARIDSTGRVRIGCTAQPSPTVSGAQFDAGGKTLRISEGGGTSSTTGSSVQITGGGGNTSVGAAAAMGAVLTLVNCNNTDNNQTSIDFTASTELSTSKVIGKNDSHSSRNGSLIFATSSGAAPAERARITSAGKIGINENSPYGDVDIASSVEDGSGALSAHGIRLSHVGATDEEVIPISAGFKSQQDRARAAIGFISKISGSSEGYAGAIGFYTRNSADGNVLSRSDEKLRIDPTGRLLLGTTSATSHAVSSSNNSLLQVESTSSDDYARASFVYNGNDGVGPGLWFAKSRGTSIGSNTIVNDGDQVGGLFFHVADGTDKHSRCASIEVKIDGTPGANDTPGFIRFLTTPDGSAAAEEKVRIPGSTWGLLVTDQSSTGSTGGYQTEGVSLRYSGDSTFVKTGGAAVTFTRKTNAGKVIDFYNGTSYAGGVYVNGANSAQYQSSSDYRLKDDITSMTDGINKVKQLNPIYYKSKMGFDTTTTQTGFLAHEVQSVIPTLVDGEKDAPIDEKGKGYQTLNYAGLAPTAIAAIKELIAKVETLESKVAALEG